MMPGMNTLVVAVVGLRFGSTFAELYHLHPQVSEVVLCDADHAAATALAARLGASRVRVLPTFEAVLADPLIDAVHLCTPIPLHVPQTVAALAAGKHVACAVPATTDVAECAHLVAAEQASGKRYFMAETQVFGSEYLLVRQLLQQGCLGRLQYLKGAHHQNMEAWPDYWLGLPPMWYATHALLPLLLLADSPITHVSCLGSGAIRPELAARYGSPFAAESALFRFANGLAAQVERTLFETAIESCESFEVFGSQASFSGGKLVQLTDQVAGWGRGFNVHAKPVHPPLRLDLLTPGFAPKLYGVDPNRPESPAHAGHGGSHPHLVDEFVRCIAEGRPSAVDARTAARCCAAAAVAHQSALQGGVLLPVPTF
jgi:predicted dehydrogenase